MKPMPAANQPEDGYYRKRDDWSESTGKLNISVFVFRDGNRNGRYDLGDRPLAAVVVVMKAENDVPVVRHSNIAGFTNFEMSTTEQASPIGGPGRRRFEVIVPPGWKVTTGNAIQEADFVTMPGSVSGLICLNPPKLVGLAPDLTLRATLEPMPMPTLDKGAGSVTLTKDGARIPVVPDQHLYGQQLVVPAGAGTLEVSRGGIKRPATVGSFPADLGTLSAGRVYATDEGGWQTIDFESAIQAGIGKIPSGYGGMGWDNFVAVDNAFYQGEGYVNGTVSGRMVAYNGSGHPTEIFHSGGFDLLGCHLTLGWLRSEGEALMVEAYQGDLLVAIDRVELSALGPVWYEPRFSRVTRVKFAAEHYWQFVIDDAVVRRLGE